MLRSNGKRFNNLKNARGHKNKYQDVATAFF